MDNKSELSAPDKRGLALRLQRDYTDNAVESLSIITILQFLMIKIGKMNATLVNT